MKYSVICLTLAGAALLLATTATAQPKNVPVIAFDLFIIHASGKAEKPDIDPKLNDLKDVLAPLGYKKLTFVRSRNYACPEWRQLGEPLPGNYQLTMVTRFLKGGKPGVKVSVTHKNNKRKPILQMTIPLKKGKPILVEGPKLKDGMLLLCFIGK